MHVDREGKNNRATITSGPALRHLEDAAAHATNKNPHRSMDFELFTDRLFSRGFGKFDERMRKCNVYCSK